MSESFGEWKEGFLRTWWRDLLAVLVVVAGSAASILFLRNAQYFVTGYQDWVYNAARANFLAIHGLTSWDHVWAMGMNYWRGFQFVPSYAIIAVAKLFDVSIHRSMVLSALGLFILFRVGIYAAARSFRARPLYAAVAAFFSLLYPGFWNVVTDFNILYGAALFPFFLILWNHSFTSRRARTLFAAVLGLSVYIHPLLALALGTLWVTGLITTHQKPGAKQIILEVVLMALGAWFYAWGLFVVDHSNAVVSSYQLTREFIGVLGENSAKFNVIYPIVALGLWCLVVIKGKGIKPSSRALLLGASIIWAAIYLNLSTSSLDILNRFQIIRMGFVPAAAIAVLLAEQLSTGTRVRTQSLYRSISVATSVTALVFSLYYASTYAPKAAATIPDPVGEFFVDHDQPQGRIFIVDSIIASYKNPQWRYVIGYNEHLLPSPAGIRLRELLTSTSPNITLSKTDLELITSYTQALGVSHLFLPQDSPFITPLLGTGSFTLAGSLLEEKAKYDVLQVVTLAPSASYLTTREEEQLTGCASESTGSAAFDACTRQVASIITNPATEKPPVLYPANNQLEVQARAPGTILLQEHYSDLWKTKTGSITKTPTGTMLLKIASPPPENVVLTNNWNPLSKIWEILLLTELLLIALALTVPTLFMRQRHD